MLHSLLHLRGLYTKSLVKPVTFPDVKNLSPHKLLHCWTIILSATHCFGQAEFESLPGPSSTSHLNGAGQLWCLSASIKNIYYMLGLVNVF